MSPRSYLHCTFREGYLNEDLQLLLCTLTLPVPSVFAAHSDVAEQFYSMNFYPCLPGGVRENVIVQVYCTVYCIDTVSQTLLSLF
jgi:hypothetical protein